MGIRPVFWWKILYADEMNHDTLHLIAAFDIVEVLDSTRDRLSALQEHMDAERANALTRNSYVLSVVAAIFLPLGFLTGLFGVNVGGMPGVENSLAFWWLTGVSLLGGIALFVIFKFAKWL